MDDQEGQRTAGTGTGRAAQVRHIASGTAEVVVVDEDHVLKVYPAGWDLAACRRSVVQAQALLVHGVPVCEPVDRLSGRAWGTVDGRPATTWAYVDCDGDEDWAALGDVLARLHRAPAAAAAGAGPMPWTENIRARLAGAALQQAATDNELAEIGRWAGLLAPVLGAERDAVVVHGDTKLANVVWSRHGPVLVDLDMVRTDTAELDLGWPAAYAASGHMDEPRLAALSAGYGRVWSWELAAANFRANQLSTLSWNIRRRSASPRDEVQARDRLDWFSRGASMDAVPDSVFE